MKAKRNLGSLAIAALLAGTVSGSLSVSPVAAESFYKGKTIKIVVRSGAGGGYDYYARLIARHMPRHLPGKPSSITINMPGAGGIVAANYMMNRAKRDGTEIAILSREIANAQRTGETGVTYDTRQLISIGSAASSTSVIVLSKSHPVKTLAQLKNYHKTVLLAATGPGSGSYQRAMLLQTDGFPVKPVTGYLSTPERMLAVVRGDTHGTSNSFESTRDQIKELGLVPIAYLGNPHPALAGVPDMRSQLSKRGKQFAALMAAPLTAGRPFLTAPNVPAERVKLLRAAFKAALADPELLKEAKKARRSISWTDPKTMDEIYRDILGASDEIVSLYKGSAKKPKKNLSSMVKHDGPVTKIKRGGRRVWIDYKGKEVRAKISGSRTKITLNGKKAKRKAIKVGMKCRFTYPKPGAEATNVDCK